MAQGAEPWQNFPKVPGRFPERFWCPRNLLGQSGLKRQQLSGGSLELKSGKYLQLQM